MCIIIPKFYILTKMNMYFNNNKNTANFTFLDIFKFQEKNVLS